MSDVNLLSEKRFRYCYSKKYKRLSAYPSREKKTPGICAKRSYFCYVPLVPVASISTHVKNEPGEQIGHGKEDKNARDEVVEPNASQDDEKIITQPITIDAIRYKMAHPKFHVSSESISEPNEKLMKEENVSVTKKEKLNSKRKGGAKVKEEFENKVKSKKPKIKVKDWPDDEPYRFF